MKQVSARCVARLAVGMVMVCSPGWPQGPPSPAPQPPRVAAAAAVQKKTDPLRDFSASLESLSRRVGRSVVQIFATGYTIGDEEGGGNAAALTRQRATGSGIILAADGYIVTNRHVVANARRVRVRIAAQGAASQTQQAGKPAGKMLEARVVGVDRDTDLAVLKIEAAGLPHLALGNSDRLRQGQLVMAFGSPMGLENSVSMGVVSSVGRQIRPDDPMTYIQTDAPINPGNSGGPLVDASGNVVGINTFILSQSGGSEGLGFAIPSSLVRNVYTQIRKAGHVHRGEIGISALTITPDLAVGLDLPQDWGVLLADVTPDGPADKAGLCVGDIVLSLNGKEMADARQLETDLYGYPVGEKVKILVLREDARLAYDVPVGERDDDPQRFADMVDPVKNVVTKLGILGIEIDRDVAAKFPDLRKKYGIVVAARAGEAAWSGGTLEPGDVIYSVNRQPVSTIDSLRQLLDTVKDTDPVVLQVERAGRLMYVTLTNE